MEIRNLKTFLQVATLENVTQAAKELGYSQSAVSVHIHKLEQELGLPLFDRIGKNVQLTDYGKALIPYARDAVKATMALEAFGQAPEMMPGFLKIGITDSLFDLLLKKSLIHYHDRFPKVTLELSVDTTANLTQALQQGSIDAACIIADPVSPTDWQIWHQIAVPIVLAANPRHPFSKRESISLADLAGSQMIMMERDAPYSQYFEKLLARHNIEYSPFLRIPSANAAKELILEEEFISLLPFYTVRSYVLRGELCVLNIPEWQLNQSVQILLHRNKWITPQIEGFLSELRTSLEAVLGEEQ